MINLASVTLAGWGLQYVPETRNYIPTKNLVLNTLQVNPKELCESIFSLQSMKDIGVRLPQVKLAQLAFGFQSDITCVGNTWNIGVSTVLPRLERPPRLVGPTD